MRLPYKTDLTDEQWPILQDLIPPSVGGRPRSVDLREVLNTIFYQDKTGCQWDMLPHDLLPKVAVHRCSDPLVMCDVRVRPPTGNHRLSSLRSLRLIHPAQDETPSPSWMSSPAYSFQDVPAPSDLAPEHTTGPRALSSSR